MASPCPKTQRFRRPIGHAGGALRVLISIALLLHLTAVISAPMALPPSSELQRGVATAFRPYLDAAYSRSWLPVLCTLAGAKSPGSVTGWKCPTAQPARDVFPNLKTQWPRLFYHRHFMLSEKLNDHLPPLDLPPDARLHAVATAGRPNGIPITLWPNRMPCTCCTSRSANGSR